MEHKGLNHEKSADLIWDGFGLKKYVFINLREQTRQKMEGFSAS